eukprot:6191404-Pleurochrysis_carterae.AAC.1
MNAAIANVILKLVPSAAVLRDAGGANESSEDDCLYDMCDEDASFAMGLKTLDEENPTWAQAMKSDEEHNWRNAARTEMHNFSRHGVYVKVSEDQLPSWNPSTMRAFEVIDMMWVLKKNRDEKVEKGGLLKYKARAVVCGNQQKSKALNSG